MSIMCYTIYIRKTQDAERQKRKDEVKIMNELLTMLEEYIKIHAAFMYWNAIHNQKSKEEKKSDVDTLNVMSAIEAIESPIAKNFKALLYYSDLEEEWLEEHPQYSDIWEYWHAESCRRAEAMRKVNNINL